MKYVYYNPVYFCKLIDNKINQNKILNNLKKGQNLQF